MRAQVSSSKPRSLLCTASRWLRSWWISSLILPQISSTIRNIVPSASKRSRCSVERASCNDLNSFSSASCTRSPCWTRNARCSSSNAAIRFTSSLNSSACASCAASRFRRLCRSSSRCSTKHASPSSSVLASASLRSCVALPMSNTRLLSIIRSSFSRRSSWISRAARIACNPSVRRRPCSMSCCNRPPSFFCKLATRWSACWSTFSTSDAGIVLRALAEEELAEQGRKAACCVPVG
mmetsp:Transcript_12516/g.24103  ORF Transcript_12516/g.24103 Transcript_12516/m.24103 type:complete len:237 (-) Transcript_12516:140-850(-)